MWHCSRKPTDSRGKFSTNDQAPELKYHGSEVICALELVISMIFVLPKAQNKIA